MSTKHNAFAMAQAQFDEVSARLKLEPAIHELLRWPMHEIAVRLPVKNG